MYNFVKASLKLFYRLFYKVTIVNGEKIENAKGVVISQHFLIKKYVLWLKKSYLKYFL